MKIKKIKTPKKEKKQIVEIHVYIHQVPMYIQPPTIPTPTPPNPYPNYPSYPFTTC